MRSTPALARSGVVGSYRASRRMVRFGLWLPLTPLFLLLSPLVLIAAPLLLVDRRARRLGPWRAVWLLGAVLTSLSGTLISVDAPRARIRLRIL